jgi:glycosidase
MKSKQQISPSIKPLYEFHIERKLRSKYQIDVSLFSQQGSVIFSDFAAVRRFVHQLNAKRDPRLHIYPGEVNAAGLLEEIFHYVFRQYEEKINPGVFDKALAHLQKQMNADELRLLIFDLLDKFPPSPVYLGQVSVKQYLEESTGSKPNLHLVLEEAIMLFFANFNPANKKLKELFDDKYLAQPELFRLMIDHLEDFFETQPPFGPENQYVFDLFKTPILSAPDDISKQLDYVMERWGPILPEKIRTLLLRGKDLLKEDVRFDTTGGGGAPTMAPRYKGAGDEEGLFTIGKSGYNFAHDAEKDYEEPEAFTPDVHWMPSVVMIAKNTYVWLDQLSKKYKREIRRLDQIPDEELDIIKKWNFTGLWLIGIWERSEASKRIKHIMGNVDAVSSAYSLFDYQIAHDLGGEDAYDNLNERTRARGIRLASDMVPNHTGIYSKWVIEHPDYFIQATQPPFPGYTFSGENLSLNPDYDIRLDDGYFSKTDAAVVFKWENKTNGQVRYIYHGNDGTNMPWNDTAQLDMLKHEVRQAVIEKIFDVARRFSIIRFDAAMTLAKKHFSRLWYPRPGTGGDIPSRADYAMTQSEFDAMFPVEFWREVVDRMNREMPETLLLAEAFWFMEGYFVRTLGMHRVYNSAFMHMLKNEENEKYRDLITNTLEFEPEILKRYVNFMSNPDEETAIRQFGTDDKYFGVCVLMNTLPGLPMFAHGQIEGYTEKYGMEYQRAYYNEEPEQWLIEKHERQIFPITRKRYLFCEVDYFQIFDFIDGYGNVNENVFAYTNRFRHEKALILYNNKYEQAHGRIHFSASRLMRTHDGKETLSVNLGEALDVKNDNQVFYIFREHFSGLEYLKRGSDIHNEGLNWSLNGFEYRLFWEFREVFDDTGEFDRLLWKTGSGVPSVQQALDELRLQPIHQLFEEIFAEDIINFLINRVMEENSSQTEKLGYTFLRGRFDVLAQNIATHFNLTDYNAAKRSGLFLDKIRTIEKVTRPASKETHELKEAIYKLGASSLNELLPIGSKGSYRENIVLLLAVFAVQSLMEGLTKDQADELKSKLKIQWPLLGVLQRSGRGKEAAEQGVYLATIIQELGTELFDFSSLLYSPMSEKIDETGLGREEIIAVKARSAAGYLNNNKVIHYIGVNEYKGVKYYSKEAYQELTNWLFTLSVLNYFNNYASSENNFSEKETTILLTESVEFLLQAREISELTGYQLEKLRMLLQIKALK